MKTETIEDQKYENILVPYFEGYRCVGYKIPNKGEYFFHKDVLNEMCGISFVEFLTYEKIPPKRYIFEETGEYRKVKTGDLYLRKEGTISRWTSERPSLFEYKILREVDEG